MFDVSTGVILGILLGGVFGMLFDGPVGAVLGVLLVVEAVAGEGVGYVGILIGTALGAKSEVGATKTLGVMGVVGTCVTGVLGVEVGDTVEGVGVGLGLVA